MAIDLWNDDDEEFLGEYVNDNSFPVIPHDTRASAIIDKAEWEVKKNFKNLEAEENCISLRFDIEAGEFKGQKIFKKFFIESDNDEQARKDYSMFMNVDANAGGKIRAMRRKPSDEDLARCLINKSMIIVIGKMDGKDGKKDMNYLMGVSSGGGKTSSQAKRIASQTNGNTKPAAEKPADLDDEDLPF